MSESLPGLRGKLDSAQQLGTVVRAMKAISAASIVRYDTTVEALSHYQRSLELGLSLCLAGTHESTVRSSAKEPPAGIIIFGSDQGLVGRYNECIADLAIKTMAVVPGIKTIWVVGERLLPILETACLTVTKRFVVPSTVTAITALATELQTEIEEYMAATPNGEILLFHNAPRATGHYEAAYARLLPLESAWNKRLRAIKWPGARIAQLLGPATLNLPALVHEYLFITLYKSCAESLASENASRLDAMQRAEKNIDTVSHALQQSINRLRQSSIDEELFDVVAGFNALV
jgi:F-type H+-transporting ATPase subunit gamma